MSDLSKLKATLLDQSTYTLAEVEYRITEAYEAGCKAGLEEATDIADAQENCLQIADAIREKIKCL
jgi:hypothetical protein